MFRKMSERPFKVKLFCKLCNPLSGMFIKYVAKVNIAIKDTSIAKFSSDDTAGEVIWDTVK